MTGVTQYALKDLNFNPQHTAPLAILAFQLMSYNRLDGEILNHDVAHYFQQATHTFNFTAAQNKYSMWDANAAVTFKNADILKGELTTHEDGLSEGPPFMLAEEDVAALVYGLHRDESILRDIRGEWTAPEKKLPDHTRSENAMNFAFAATALMDAYKKPIPPFIMRTAALINPAWAPDNFESAADGFDKNIITDRGVFDRERTPFLSEGFYLRALEQQGTRQFLCTCINQGDGTYNYLIWAAKANGIEPVLHTRNVMSAILGLRVLEGVYILPEMQKNSINMHNLLRQKNDLLHFGSWFMHEARRTGMDIVSKSPPPSPTASQSPGLRP